MSGVTSSSMTKHGNYGNSSEIILQLNSYSRPVPLPETLDNVTQLNIRLSV